ncbi:hypothetical protein FSP39_018594 [Pinctada imbricata]|uniref:Ciliogenesis and planar polarity effector 2 n=1 Tax=Pinctada imbricata TaxID=66713 RepID=A0AA88Y118_PINIB|nr:hypothetical protein FSP39_018594 [Pinctada imbricata]
MISPGTLLNQEWYGSPQGREVLATLLHKSQQRRKTFGLLEKPMIGVHCPTDEVKYKVFLVGKSGVGKTSTVAKISGNAVPTAHSETPGIQTTTVYWAGQVKQLNKVIMFSLQFWDAGESATKKYDHILPACVAQTDCIIFLFSFVDRSSFEDVSQLITKMTTPKDTTCKIVIGTKFDQHAHSEITQRDIRDFEQNWKIPILKIRNVPDTEGRNHTNETSQILCVLCEHLWHRDIIMAGRSPSTDDLKDKQNFV